MTRRSKGTTLPVKPQEAPAPADVAIGPVSQALGVLTLAHTEIRPGPWQPRTVFDETKLQELAESIKARGILVPLRVARATDGQGGYWLVSGERRWRAAALAGLETLPCLLAVLTQSPDGSNQAQLDALLENMHRDDLRPGEEAHGLKALADFGLTQREIAEATGKSQAWVADRLGLLKLPDKAVEALDHGVITVEEARALKKLADTPELIDSCLAGDNKTLGKATGGQIWAATVGHRAEQVAGVLAGKRAAEKLRAQLQSEGKTLLGQRACEGLPWLYNEEYGEGARHKELGLTCVGYYVPDSGEVRMYCTDPKAFNASRPKESAAERRQREERAHNRLVERSRDEAIRLWAAAPTLLKGDYPDDLLTFFRVKIALGATHTPTWSQVATWLGIEGKNQGERAAAFWRTLGAVPNEKTWERPVGLENVLLHLATPRLVQLWMLQELAGQVSSYSIVPTAYAKWLEDIGFKTPRPGSIPGKKLVEVVGDDGGETTRQEADRHCRRCLCDRAKPCSADDTLVPDQEFPDEGDICTDCVAEQADQEKLLAEARQTITVPAAVPA